MLHTEWLARRKGTAGAKRRRQLHQCVEAGFSRVLIHAYQGRLAFLGGDSHRNDLSGGKSPGLGRQGTLLTAQREPVLIPARYPQGGGHLLAGLKHPNKPRLLPQGPVPKTPTLARVA